MRNEIAKFLKHSAIYSIGNAAYKAIGVITLPLYTMYIPLSQFGVLGLIEVTLLILTEILSLGQSNSIIIFNKDKDGNLNKSAFFTIFSSVLAANILFLFVGTAMGNSLVNFLDLGTTISDNYLILIFIVFLRVFNSIFLYKLRADEKSLKYTLITLLKIALTLGLVIYLVGFLKMEVIGVLYSYLISEAIIIFILLPMMIHQMQIKLDTIILNDSLKFGLPLIFSAIGITLLNISDRYILNIYTSKETVGLYDLGYRIAGIINMFLIMPFSLTLLPIAADKFGKEGDKRYYSKLMTYLVFIITWVGLALALFSEEVIKIFSLNKDYYPAAGIIPLVVLGYIFSATRNMASLSLFLKKRSMIIALITIASAAFNIGLNFWLVPEYGMYAAALNTVIAFLAFHFVTLYFANKEYPIPYENRKYMLAIIIGVIFYIISLLILDSGIIKYLGSFFLLLLYPLALYLLGFYEAIEIKTLKDFYKKLKNPKEAFISIKELLK